MSKQEISTIDERIKMLAISEVFNNVEYMVPIYQRNYAWEKDQIEQLLQDIQDVSNNVKNYYLGSLIVNKVENRYEVIDGQQRLTTLYLMMLCLNGLRAKYGLPQTMIVPEEALIFEARDKSNATFKKMKKGEISDEWASVELKNGYNIISSYFDLHFVENNQLNSNYEKFSNNLKKVNIVRVQVPEGIDLNHYFEIMNTRGEQLTPHEIVKARILAVLNKTCEKKVVEAAARIWDACAMMDSYVQMNFDTETRKKMFGEKWTDFNCNSFDSAVALCIPEEKTKKAAQNNQNDEEKEDLTFILSDFLKNGAILKESEKIKDSQKEEQERFDSVITFPNFLLHVNAIVSANMQASLDDKDFLDTLKKYWEDVNQAKVFIFATLKCRCLFDKYIIKREFYKDYRDEGRWTLQGIKAYQDKKKNTLKPQYFGTYNSIPDNIPANIEDKSHFDTDTTKRIRMLESCLRITYTSPKMMHWITEVLDALYKDEVFDLIPLLENHCRQKVVESDFAHRTGFAIERIVFTYLDYLLWRDGYSYAGILMIGKMGNYHYQYRNSIEHFSPQHPAERKPWDDSDLNSFGNLALVTVSGNSKFSNNEPIGKIKSFESVVRQSLKLIIMAEMTKNKNSEWTQEMAESHKNEMLKILQDDVELLKD